MKNKKYLRGLINMPDALVEWEDFDKFAHNPESILIDGIPASFEAMAKEHGYNWRSTASGRELFYLREDGKIFSFLITFFRKAN